MDPGMRFLVTGAQGFVGRYLVHTLLTSFPTATVIGIGRSPFTSECFTHSLVIDGGSHRAPLPACLRVRDDRYRYRALDLIDKSATTAAVCEFAPHVVFHLASGLRGDPVQNLISSGIEASARLMEALAALVEPPRVVLGSSGAVYGAIPEQLLPIAEDTPTKPADLYGMSKLAAEHACRVLGEKHKIPVIIARLFNLVGPGQDERHVCGRFMAEAVAIANGSKAPEMQIGPLHHTRDFIDVRDCVRALLLLSVAGLPGEIYNIASGVETRIASVLEIVLDQTGLRDHVRIFYRECNDGIQRHYAANGRINALGFRANRTLVESLRDIRDYYFTIYATASREAYNIRPSL